MKVFKEEDANPAAVKSAPVAVIGYGSQGRAPALNLKNSGCDVIVGVREGGKGAKQAAEDGLEVASPAKAAAAASLIAILTPDMTHETIFNEDIAPNLQEGDALLFAHRKLPNFGRRINRQTKLFRQGGYILL